MPKPDSSKKAFDIHKTLPTHRAAKTHQPTGRNSRLEKVAEITPEEKRRGFSFKRALASVLVILFLFVIVIGVWDARNISSATSKLFGTDNVFSLLSPTSLKKDSNGRVNVLIVGYSADDPGHSGANLTDSILLLSMNPANKTGYMLSIPRDLYVEIPGFGHAKINEAYQDGGMSLLEQVVTSDFGVQIGYYVIVDYTAVKQTVDALGGITVNIQSTDPRGLYDPNINTQDGGPLLLPNGPQKLNGQTALNLTRARGDAYNSYGFAQSDFDRTQHQRQILTAIKDKLSWKLVLNPSKNSQILNAVASNVKTDVAITQARPLFGTFNSIPSAQLLSLSLRSLNGTNYLVSYTTSSGQSALVPSAGIDDYSQIQAALADIGNQKTP